MLFLGSDPGYFCQHITNSFTLQDRFINQAYETRIKPRIRVCLHAQLLYTSASCSVMSDSATPWTVACQAPLSMGFSRQEYWSGLLFPPPGDLPETCVSQVSCTGRWALYYWDTWEVPMYTCYYTCLIDFSPVTVSCQFYSLDQPEEPRRIREDFFLLDNMFMINNILFFSSFFFKTRYYGDSETYTV